MARTLPAQTRLRERDQRPPLAAPTDAVIYELHVRDFSIHQLQDRQ